MAAPIFSLRSIGLRYGAHPLFDDLTLHLGAGDRVALVGRNGTGKSTLMKVIAGLVDADAGDRFVKPGLSVSYLRQEPDTRGYETLRDFVIGGLPDSMIGEEYRADSLIDALSVKGALAPNSASGGEVRRAALARSMVSEPDLLLLDEPTNHLDLRTILWLEQHLKSLRCALVLISHDRTFLSALTNASLWLDRGQVRRYDGPFAKFDDWRDKQMEEEATERAKLDKKIAEESRWAVEGISARRKRNQGRLRRLYDMRQTRREQIKAPGTVTLSVSSGEGSGTRVAELREVSKSYGGRTLFSGFSTRIHRGDRIGILGPNGAGKSTLVKTLMGETAPDSGTVKLGSNLTPLVIDQKRSDLAETLTLKDVLTGGRGDYVHRPGGEAVHVRTYMKEFLFKPEQADTPVSALSGGERGRLLLAAGFAKASNLLVLDEPTNDLDMETLDLLVEVLADYDGTLILVSHDRDFLDRTVTSTIVFEGDGTATEYAGGYSDYLNQKAPTVPSDSATLVKFKPKDSLAPKTKKQASKLSYKDQRALDLLPAEIESLNGEIQQLEATLADPKLYAQDPHKFAKVSKQLEAHQATLEEKELEWLELEEKKEMLERGDG